MINLDYKALINALVKPLLVWAMSWGALLPPCAIPVLKSSTAFPNHMRRIKKEVKPNITIQAQTESTKEWR
jgi:hypothetical protein